MIKKIFRWLKTYFAALNMSHDAVRLFKWRKISGRSAEHSKENKIRLNILLFVATFITTTLAGASDDETIWKIFLSGLPFSATLMSILLAHEMGHFLAARHFGVKASLPYFIPFPSVIGTMGAVIKIKSPIKDKKALLYIGAMGPLAGFILSLIASAAGIYYSDVMPLPQNPDGIVPIFGDSFIYSILISAIHGQIPAGHDVFLSSYAWAGWIGFLITGLNLMPMGQLDGSHIVYALIGRKQLYIGWLAFAALIALSFIWIGWVVWIIIALLLLMIGHPPVEDEAGLTTFEKFIGLMCVFIFFITFIPIPVQIIGG